MPPGDRLFCGVEYSWDTSSDGEKDAIFCSPEGIGVNCEP